MAAVEGFADVPLDMPTMSAALPVRARALAAALPAPERSLLRSDSLYEVRDIRYPLNYAVVLRLGLEYSQGTQPQPPDGGAAAVGSVDPVGDGATDPGFISTDATAISMDGLAGEMGSASVRRGGAAQPEYCPPPSPSPHTGGARTFWTVWLAVGGG